MAKERKSLLSSQALVQVPWVKVTIGDYTFGVANKQSSKIETSDGFYQTHDLKYPNYVQSLQIVKINGQVNQYTLSIQYPVRVGDDPNFFEKVFSSVSKTRKIVFSYGDASMPTYIYKDEEAIITKIQTAFNFGNGGSMGSVIGYTVSAVSSAALGKIGAFPFMNATEIKPSDEIKRIFLDSTYGLQNIFTGMSASNIDDFIDGSDKKVKVNSKTNISPLDYINYLVSCMVPGGTTAGQTTNDIYVLTLHDDTVYDKVYNDTVSHGGPYFKVTRTTYAKSQSDAYEIDIGYNTRTIVTNFSVSNQENYSMYYEYANENFPQEYVRRLNSKGQWEDVFAPVMTSNNDRHTTIAEDMSWYTKITQYPISASITIQGLLRPATLMQYVRLNVIFPGGVGDAGERKHISSGLYIVTKQTDRIDNNGYKTTLDLQKISGDDLSAPTLAATSTKVSANAGGSSNKITRVS